MKHLHSHNKIIQISNQELLKLINLSKKVQKLINQLTRRIDNRLVIEQAAVIAALKPESLKDIEIGKVYLNIFNYASIQLKETFGM